MLKFLSIFLITFTGFSTFASDRPVCTAWTKQDGVSCIFAGESANIYKRQCENSCWMCPSCDREEVCHFNNPATFKSVCSEWIKVSRVTCYDPNLQSWEQQWVRSCTVNLKESWCSREIPLE